MSQGKATSRQVPLELTLVRTFDAPRDIVFKAWTDPAQLSSWWGPAGFTTTMKKWAAHPEGEILLDMNAPNGAVYPMGGGFVEVDPPGRLVFKSSALDNAGKSILEVLNTVSFADENGKTKLTLHTRVLSMEADANRYLKGQKMGWTQSLERLDALVAGPDP